MQSNAVQYRIRESEYSSGDLLQDPRLYHYCVEMSNDYFLIFNDRLQLIDLNRSCFKTLKDESLPKSMLIGRDIHFYLPDFKATGAFDKFMNISRCGGIFELDDYLINSSVNKDSIHVRLKMFISDNIIVTIGTDITEQKQNKEFLQRQDNRINELKQDCSNLKSALDVLLKRLEEKHDEIEKNYYYNLEEMVFPMLDILKTTVLDNRQAATLDILESNLKTITDPFARLLNIGKRNFTQREIQIANLIRLGKTTKEISEMLHLSCKTVDFHRAGIRKRLDIKNTKDNLRSFLLAMSEQSWDRS